MANRNGKLVTVTIIAVIRNLSMVFKLESYDFTVLQVGKFLSEPRKLSSPRSARSAGGASSLNRYGEEKVSSFPLGNRLSHAGETKYGAFSNAWGNVYAEDPAMDPPWDIDQLSGSKACFTSGDGDIAVKIRVIHRPVGTNDLKVRAPRFGRGGPQFAGHAKLRGSSEKF
jgi:hypothetical protein